MPLCTSGLRILSMKISRVEISMKILRVEINMKIFEVEVDESLSFDK